MEEDKEEGKTVVKVCVREGGNSLTLDLTESDYQDLYKRIDAAQSLILRLQHEIKRLRSLNK